MKRKTAFCSIFHFAAFRLITRVRGKFLAFPVALVILSVAPAAHAKFFLFATDVTIETTTNGVDADAPPGQEIFLDAPITWTYTVTNTGDVPLERVDVYDHVPDGWFGFIFGTLTHVCTLQDLPVGESQTCTLQGTATLGEYRNTGIAKAHGRYWWQRSTDKDKSHYHGTLGNPAIDLEKTTQGNSADAAPGPELYVGDQVEWRFIVTNTGDVDLSNVVVTDQQIQPATAPPVSVCEISILVVGESQTCALSGIAIEGQYQNLGYVTAQGLGDSGVNAEDPSHYVGIINQSLTAQPHAVPTSGEAPLQVTFTPNATTNNAIIRYEWDFESDGVYDRSETVGRDQVFTYNTPDNYNATLRVTDNTGEQATGVVVITVNNGPPEVSVTLTPSNGQVPLIVNFSAVATDPDGIAEFEWDYDGDGVFDETTPTGNTSFTYDVEGAYQAQVRVTDTLGATTTLTIPTLVVSALPPGSPTVTLDASPFEGNASLLVTLSATSTDPEGEPIDQYEWDVDGDGVYDLVSNEPTVDTTYSDIGTFYPRVRVTDSEGLQAEDATSVFVVPEVNLAVSVDTIEPLLSETVSVNTTLGGNTEVSVVIEDSNGQLVRTLVPFETRAAGSYQDVWDGMDDTGNIVSEGEYRAILLYRLDGAVNRLDLALTSGGVQSNPPRSGIPPTFSPFNNDPLDITFTLNRASEVTAFMGLFNVNTRLVTFLQRRALGRGTHEIIWNGENSDGQLIEPPPGDRFLFGIFAYTLPDNAIYVRSGVHVSSVTASPSILQPTQGDFEDVPNLSEIQIELNRAGNVNLVIHDTETGSQVAEFTYTGLAAGTNTITWDGRDNDNNLVSPGAYRLGVSGVDETGFESLTVYTLQRIFY